MNDAMTVRLQGVENPASFRTEAAYQRVCQACGSVKGWHAHHVVYEQVLKRYGLKGKELYNTLNALRLCTECHRRQHSGISKIPTVKLRLENITYAFAILGPYAGDWLRRYYDDSAADERIVAYDGTGVPS